VIGQAEKARFITAESLAEFRDLLHERQSVDAYYAMPRFFRDVDGKVIGAYAITEGVDSIFPIEPFVPFGTLVEKSEALKDADWWTITLVSYDGRYQAIGEMQYHDFIRNVENKEYHDAKNVIIRGLSLGEMKRLLQKIGFDK
jgi:hypothetical protein